MTRSFRALAASPSGSSSTALATTDAADPERRWTRERQGVFLRSLAASNCVADAAREAGMSRQSAYRLRARLKGEPFDLAWHAALRCRFDALAEAAVERAIAGVEVPHYYRGELVGTSRKYDERLTVALLAMRDRFAAPHLPPTHAGSAYNSGDFGPLLERVETGPETWLEEAQIAHADDAEDEGESEDEGEDFECEDWESTGESDDAYDECGDASDPDGIVEKVGEVSPCHRT